MSSKAAPTTPFLKSPGIRSFFLIWSGQLVSIIGSALTGFGLGVFIYQETGSKLLFILNTLAFMIPQIIVTPFTGALVDRWDRRVAMLVSDAGAGLAVGSILLLKLSGYLEIWHVIVATLFISSFNTMMWPAWSAAQTLLVPKEHLGRAGGFTQIGDAVGQLLAPALGGLLFVTVGLGGIVAIDVATFVFSVITLVIARVPKPERSAVNTEGKTSIWQEAQFGFRYIWQRKPLLGLLLYFASINFLGGVFNLIPPMMLDVTTPEVFGYVGSIVGLGMLVGTLVMSAWGGPKRKIIGLLGFGGLSGVFILVMGLRMYIPLMTLGGFFLMFTFPILNACSQAIWQRKVEPDVQGRVFSARRVIAWVSGIPGTLIATVLAEKILDPLMAANGPLTGTWLGSVLTLGPGRGTGVLFMIVGALTVIASVAFYLIPQVRHVEDLLPDAVGDQPTEAESDSEIPAGDVTVLTPA